MRILFISHYFPPEEPPAAFLAFEFCRALNQAGHDVDVLTGYPNWPSGHVFDGYSRCRVTTQNMDGVIVHRLPFLASPSGRFIRRALDFTSFQLLVKWYGRKLPCPDLIYVLVPPNEDGIAARYLGTYFDCPYVLNVQDLHPDTSINLGFVKNRLLIYLLRKQASTMYEDAEHVVTIGSAIRKMLIDKGVSSERVSILPNWIDTETVVPADKNNALQKEWEIDNDVFVVLYAGTFGRIHGTSILLDVANQLREHNILLLLVGQGYDFDMLANEVDGRGLQNILVKPFVPRNRLSEMQALADVSIVLTKSGFGLTSVPSKVLGYMAASRPILAAVDAQSDTANLISAANAGIVVEPENVAEIVSALIALKNKPKKLKQWGMNAREYVTKHLSPDVVLAEGVKMLEQILKQYRGQV
jgi:glycosyltransferase involved in cell wall biosynthesis